MAVIYTEVDYLQKSRLIVRVLEARGLKAGNFFSGTSDAYVEVRIKDHTRHYKSRVVKGSVCPVWNEEFQFPVGHPENEFLLMKVYNYDTFSSNELLGEIEIPVTLFASNIPTEHWKHLQTKKGPNYFVPAHGEIKFQASFVPSGTVVMPPQQVMMPQQQMQFQNPPAFAPNTVVEVVPPMQPYPVQQMGYPMQQPGVVYQQPGVVYQQPQVYPGFQQPQVVLQQQPQVMFIEGGHHGHHSHHHHHGHHHGW